MYPTSEISNRLRNPLARRWLALALGLGLSCSAAADTTTLGVSDATISTRNVPVTLNFPVARSGELTYDAVLSYHTMDGSAFAGIDYTAAASSIIVPAGSTSANIPVTIAARLGGGADQTFQLFTDAATGIGPAPDFAAQQTFVTGTNPFSVAMADLNGDGKPDAIVANYIDNTVSVLLNTTAPGAGTATFAAQQSFNTGVNPYSVTTADINGDGKPDLIVANTNNTSVSVLLNTTAPGASVPSFAAQQSFAAGTAPRFVAVADVNGDGKPDLIVANFSDNTVSVLLNTTAPGAAAPNFALQQTFVTGTHPHSITTADLNGDGKSDLIVGNVGSNTVSVLLNTTAPGATTPNFAAQQGFATGASPSSVSTADINGDGKPDLIVTNESANTISVLLNTTTPGATAPSFAAQQGVATGASPSSVSTADVNGDGKPDLIVANANGNTVSVLLNITAPGATILNFAAQQIFATGVLPISSMTADLNGDGKPDLIVANFSDNTISVLLNTTPTAGATLNFAPQQQVATGSSSHDVTTADLNGDGRPDLIVANAGANNVSVLLDTTPPGAATPTFTTQQTFATGASPYSVKAADLNGDGKADLVVANNTDATVSVLLNNTAPGAATPSFATQQTFATGASTAHPQSVAVADVNGDGLPDLIVANTSASTVAVLLNTTAPGLATLTFATQVPFDTGTNPYAVTTADVNGDGLPDLILAANGSTAVSVLLNTTTPGAATPTFSAHQEFPTVTGGPHPVAIASADINGDGLPDAIVTNYQYGNSSVSVLLNTTTPGAAAASFAAQQPFATGEYPFSVTTADVDGDGRADVIVGNYFDYTVSVLLNTTTPGAATPSFAAQKTYGTGLIPYSVAAADVNGDGKPDLIVANAAGFSTSVLLNTQYQGVTAGSPVTGTITHDVIFADGFE